MGAAEGGAVRPCGRGRMGAGAGGRKGQQKRLAPCWPKKLIFEFGATQALFSYKIFYKIDTVAFSFVFDKYCPIMD